MKVAWIHTFDPGINASGIFMHELTSAIRKRGVELELFYAGNVFSPIEFVKSAIHLRKKTKYFDLVHAQYGSGCGLLTTTQSPPKIITLRGSDWYGTSGSGSLRQKFRGQMAKIATHIALKYSSGIISVSARIAEELSINYKYMGIDVIVDGVNLDIFKPMDRQAARAALNCADDYRPWILFGTVTLENPVKRAELALEAVNWCRRSEPEAEMKLITGMSREEVALMMCAGDVLLLTSLHEGWPNVVKESLACGTPFVSTDVSDLAAFSENLPNCKVIHSSDPKIIGESLSETISSLRSRGFEKDILLRQSIQNMSIDDVAQRIIEFYKKILHGNRNYIT